MAARGFGWGFAAFPAMAIGGLVLVPVLVGARGARAAMGAAAAGQAAMAAPLRRALAEAADHVGDRLAAVRAEVAAAVEEEAEAAPGPPSEVRAAAARARAEAGALAGVDVVIPGGAGGDAPETVRLAHEGPDRIRLVLRGPGDAEAQALLLARIRAFPGVASARLRMPSGSLVIETAGSAEGLVARLERAGLVTLAGHAARPLPAEGAALLLGWMDGLLRLRTGGRLDLDQVLAMAVIAAGVLARDPAYAGLSPGALAARVTARRRLGRR